MTSMPAHVTISTTPVRMFGEHAFRFLLTGQDTGGSYSVMHLVSPLASGPGPHVDADSEEHFHVLDGKVRFTVGAESLTAVAGAGDVVHIPRGTLHDFEVTAATVTMMATFSPAGDEQILLDGSIPGLSE